MDGADAKEVETRVMGSDEDSESVLDRKSTMHYRRSEALSDAHIMP